MDAADMDGLPQDRRSEFNVLILDDSSFDQVRMKRACMKTGLPVTISIISDIEELPMALDDRVFDIVLVDYMLPRGDGLKAQNIVQNHPMNYSAAVVMVSSDMRPDVAVAAIKTGALDCLDKQSLDENKLRELMVTSAKVFADASRHWMGEILEKHRAQIAQDVSRVVRREMEFGQLVDTIDKRIIDMLSAHGVVEPYSWDGTLVLNEEEPFKFR